MRKSRKSRRAFTLIELVIVMLVMGILAGVAAPKYANSVTAYRVDLAARELQADFGFAASEAQRTSSDVQVDFDLTDETYSLVGVADLDHPTQDFIRDLPASRSVSLTSADFNSSTSVTFDMYGRASAAGSVVLSSPGEARLVELDSSGVVTITRTITTF